MEGSHEPSAAAVAAHSEGVRGRNGSADGNDVDVDEGVVPDDVDVAGVDVEEPVSNVADDVDAAAAAAAAAASLRFAFALLPIPSAAEMVSPAAPTSPRRLANDVLALPLIPSDVDEDDDGEAVEVEEESLSNDEDDEGHLHAEGMTSFRAEALASALIFASSARLSPAARPFPPKLEEGASQISEEGQCAASFSTTLAGSPSGWRQKRIALSHQAG